jgi:4'-phosphopantetheinyl transferase
MDATIAAPGGVDLWTVSLDRPAADEARLIASCSPAEQARAARMPVARRRRDFLVARGIVRTVLGTYLEIPAAEVRIATRARGKPFVASPAAPAFSVSHSHRLAVVAVTPGFEVGVDLELVDPRLDVVAVARRFLSAQEAVRLAGLDPAARARAFFRLWTRKEAYAKATGRGLTVPLGELLGSPEPRSATHTTVDIDPASGYVGALAYAAPPTTLHTRSHLFATVREKGAT